MNAQLVKHLEPYNTIANVSKHMTIQSMAELIAKHPEIHCLCVIDDANTLLGLITRKRLFQAIYSHHVAASTKVTELYSLLTSEHAEDLLIKHFITCNESDPVDKVIKVMIEHRLNAIPVLNKDENFKGLVTVERLLAEWLKSNK